VPLPPIWNGLFWGRTGCDFAAHSSGNCDSGGCDGLNCTKVTQGTVTFVQMGLGGSAEGDSADVDMIRGFNLPLGVSSSSACPGIGCAANLTEQCPPPLQVKNAGGDVVACSSSCAAKLRNTDKNCCTGQYSNACDPSSIDYYSFFHNACPEAMNSQADPPVSIESFEQCYDDQDADYVITFCPLPSSDFLSVAPPSSTIPTLVAQSTSLGQSQSAQEQESPTPMFPEMGHDAATGRISTGAIVGIVLGGYSFILLVAMGAILVIRRRRRRAQDHDAFAAHESVRPYVILPSPSAEAPSLGFPEKIVQPPVSDFSQLPSTGEIVSSPVDIRQLFESRILEEQLLQFIAERMDTTLPHTNESESPFEPPDYRSSR